MDCDVVSSILECLQNAANKFIQETGTGGFCKLVLTNEVYDKMFYELGSKIHFKDRTSCGSGKLFLGDRYVEVERATPLQFSYIEEEDACKE